MANKTAISSTKKSTVPEPQAKASTVKPLRSIKKHMSLISCLLAEFFGTFLLVASIFAVQGQPLFVAFALIGIILIFGGISGAHVNPAITIGAWVTKKIESKKAIGYIVAQILGAGFAWLILSAFMSGSEAASAQTTTGSLLFHTASLTSGKEMYIFFAELLGSIILALGIATALKAKQNQITTAFSYGLSLLIGLVVAGSITAVFLTESNTSLTFLNPAAAIAANGLSWNIWPIAIYIFAPVIGAVIGFVMQDFLYTQTNNKN